MNHDKLFTVLSELEDLLNRHRADIVAELSAGEDIIHVSSVIVVDGKRHEFFTHTNHTTQRLIIDLEGDMGLYAEFRKFRGRIP